MKTLGSTAALLFVLAAAVGCASSEVTERQSYIGDEKLSRPNRIIVYDFAATPADVPADSALAGQSVGHSTPQTPEEIETGRELGAQVAKELVGEIHAMGLPAVRAAGQPAPGIGDLVIRGYFVSIREGSAGKRLLVGFGSGANELRTVVEGYQMTSHGLRPLGMRETEAGGGEMPGMLVPVAVLAATGSPVGLIVGGAAKLKGETGSETIEGAAKRTAKEIGQELQIAFERQGWIRVAAAKPEPQAVQSAALGTSQTAAAPIISDREAFALQLASFKNAEAAEQEWSAIQGRFPKLLDEASAVVQPANVEGIGKVYRLKAGTFPNRATAADVCAQLKAARQDCLVVQR
jgi:hypothetical protein